MPCRWPHASRRSGSKRVAARVEADLLAVEGDQHRVADLVAELEDLTRAYPLREGFTAQLMRALAAGGRTAEALTAYQRLRETLADTLGTDPSPALRTLHTAMLRDGASHPTVRAGPRAAASCAPA